MSKTKLVDLNIGVRLTVLRNGKEQKVSLSMTCPSHEVKQPHDAMFYLRRFLEDEFGIDIDNELVTIAKPPKIKAHRRLTHEQFNKRVKELVP